MPSSEVMNKFSEGKLKSSSGQKVTNPMQAIAIKYSEKRAEQKHGGKYPEKKAKRSTFYGE